MPAIASAVDSNLDVVGADCGLLATMESEERRAYPARLASRAAEMSDAGRSRVEQNYSMLTNLSVLAGTICTAVAK